MLAVEEGVGRRWRSEGDLSSSARDFTTKDWPLCDA